MSVIVNPYGKFSALIVECKKICESKINRLAKAQTRLEEYREKNPDNVLRLNAWQKELNDEAEETEYLIEAISEVFPALFEAESKRKFLKGREFEKNGGNSPFVSVFRDENHKEAVRLYSIANQRLQDNI